MNFLTINHLQDIHWITYTYGLYLKYFWFAEWVAKCSEYQAISIQIAVTSYFSFVQENGSKWQKRMLTLWKVFMLKANFHLSAFSFVYLFSKSYFIWEIVFGFCFSPNVPLVSFHRFCNANMPFISHYRTTYYWRQLRIHLMKIWPRVRINCLPELFEGF